MSMQVFRNKKNMQVIYFTVAIAFVLSLGYAGVKSGSFFGHDPDTLASVNGKAIKYLEWDKEYRQRVEQYKSMFFKDGEIPEIYLKDIRKSTLQNLVNQYLLLEYARKCGISSSEAEDKEKIKNIFSPGGKFNANAMRYWLKEKKMTEDELIIEINRFNTLTKVQQIVNDSAKVSDNEIAEEYSLKNEQRKVRYIKFDPANFVKLVKVSPEEITRYYNERKQEFSIAEQLRVQYAMLDFSRAFDKTAKDKAAELIKKLSDGADFSALAKENSDDPGSKDNGGDLSFFKKGMMVPEFEKAAFALKAGEYTKEPVKTQFGYHIIKVDEKKGDEVRARHILIKPSPDANGKAAALEKLAGLKKDLAAGAKTNGLAVIDAAFSRADSLNPKDIDPDEQEIVKAAIFKLKPGETSDPVETRKGFYVIKLTGLTPESFRSLDMVRSKIEDNLKKEKATPFAEAEAENIYKTIKDKAITFDKAGAKYGVKDTGYFLLTDKTIKGVEESSDFIKTAKSLKTKGEVGRLVKSLNGFYLIELTDIKQPDLKKFDKEKETLKAEILKKKQGTSISNFIDGLRKKATINDYSEKMFADMGAEQQ